MFHAPTSPPRRRAWALVVAASLAFPCFSAQSATNTPPTISGTPPTTAKVGTNYIFVPTGADADGNKLTYTITNKPDWMWFGPGTGKLSGTPKKEMAGRTFSGIQISVTDGV